ncbi:MAG: TatD family hydrolase [Gammaproteobacteria bacterium]|nr:TatD family hydrolase [Gammaproteobacteria bacterium]MCW8909049.1 TatD family hydrolase [Gammaproteobacteria bacterium]MCW9005578.1 TatD family hydrolase [Gammaproteobacteria bacterium]MCW9056685.1 TatD family hydrolase [Gammaproteobacteria bacterium]
MIIDCHCHIDFEAFDSDREQVLDRAQQAGIEHLIVPGVSADTWPRIKTACNQYRNLHPCYGLHPYYIDQHTHEDIVLLEEWIIKEKPVAIGECGLDFYLKDLNKEKQIAFFQAQLEIAQKHNLPVVIHSRKATEEIIYALKKFPGLKGMIHSYSGSYEQALQLIDLGFYLSFGGAITYDRATRLREIVRRLPLDSLLIETDAPDQPDLKHHKQRNEPAYIKNVIVTLNDLRNEGTDAICNQTTANCKLLFSL